MLCPCLTLTCSTPTCAQVPLILGIWGGKGQGKTFQCNLAYKKLGIAPIVMSAGELESGNAGEPAKLIRQRYREASDIIKKGKMSSLFINDLDAGAGRMGDATQVRGGEPAGHGCSRVVAWHCSWCGGSQHPSGSFLHPSHNPLPARALLLLPPCSTP